MNDDPYEEIVNRLVYIRDYHKIMERDLKRMQEQNTAMKKYIIENCPGGTLNKILG